jgi:hypothetical protein
MTDYCAGAAALRIRSAFVAKLAGWLAAQPLLWLARTLTYHVTLETPGTNPADPECPGRYLFALWHDSILIPIMIRQRIRRHTEANRIAALVSRHQDGSYLVEAMRQFTIDSVRGSTTRGGALALRQLSREANARHVFITPDGPQGPRRQLKQGIVYLASQTGLPIVPTAFGAPRAWVITGNWTDLVIPKPFSHTYLVLGSPIFVPPDLSRDELERYRQRVQDEMERLDQKMWQLAAGQDVEPAARKAA